MLNYQRVTLVWKMLETTEVKNNKKSHEDSDMCLVDPPNLLIVELTSVTKKTSEGCLFRWRVGLAAGRRSCRQWEGKGRLGSRIQTSTSTRFVGIVDNLYAKKAHYHGDEFSKA